MCASAINMNGSTHIYSVKTKSQSGNIEVKYTMTTQKAKAKRKSARDLRNLI